MGSDKLSLDGWLEYKQHLINLFLWHLSIGTVLDEECQKKKLAINCVIEQQQQKRQRKTLLRVTRKERECESAIP